MSIPERLVFLDTETTGVSVKQGDRIVEIGCKEVVDHQETGRVFHAYLNPQRPMPPDAERIHGLSDDFLKDKPVFAEKAAEFAEFVAGATLVIHNAQFDVGFLLAELGRVGMEPTWSKVVDTVRIARLRFLGAPVSLDALADRFGVDRSSRTLHGALLDADLLWKVYVPLMGLNQLIPLGIDLGEESVEVAPADLFLESARQRWFPERALSAPSEEELARHAKFVAGLAKGDNVPLWRAVAA